ADLGPVVDAADVGRRRGVAAGAQAERAELVLAPAPHLAAGLGGAGREQPDGERGPVAAAADRRRRGAVDEAAVAELPEAVLADAVGAAGRGARAGLLLAGGDRGPERAPWYHRRRRQHGHGRAAAELTVRARAPAGERAVAEQAAGVLVAGGERGPG